LAWIGILVQWQLQEQEIGREVSFIFGTTRQRLCCKMISLAGARDSMSFPPMTDVVYGRYTTLLSPAYTWIDRRWWIYTGRRRRRGKSRVACENSLLLKEKPTPMLRTVRLFEKNKNVKKYDPDFKKNFLNFKTCS
jgi:hypothetical protein